MVQANRGGQAGSSPSAASMLQRSADANRQSAARGAGPGPGAPAHAHPLPDPAAPSHLDLLAIATDVRAAVQRDDTESLHAGLTKLRSALMDHARAERSTIEALPAAVRSLAFEGQRRLLRLLTDILFSPAGPDDTERCDCAVKAVQIDIALRRQAELETMLLRRYGLGGSSSRSAQASPERGQVPAASSRGPRHDDVGSRPAGGPSVGAATSEVLP